MFRELRRIMNIQNSDIKNGFLSLKKEMEGEKLKLCTNEVISLISFVLSFIKRLDI